jgi:hypothetical protein
MREQAGQVGNQKEAALQVGVASLLLSVIVIAELWTV